jgi:hypothetical protein
MINRISLAECLEQYSPPAKVLDVSVLDDTAFICICDVGETHDTETHQETAAISVSLPSLIEALNLLAVDAEREHLRPCEDEQAGTRETRLAGRRLTVVPVAPWSAVAALTEHHRYTPEPGTRKRQHGEDGSEGEAET